MFRKDGYLLNYNNQEETLTSVSGEYLDYSLCDFNFVIKENYAEYKNEYKLNGSFGSKKPTPVFITNEERIEFGKIESKTINEIKIKIKEIAKAMPNKDISLNVLHDLEKKKLKLEFVELYKESAKLLDEQVAALDAQIGTAAQEELELRESEE